MIHPLWQALLDEISEQQHMAMKSGAYVPRPWFSAWRLESFMIEGKLAGYPACCIRDFVLDAMDRHSPGERRVSEFPELAVLRPGYVPCRVCARRLLGSATAA